MAPPVEPFYGELGRSVAVARTRRGMTQEQLGRSLRPPLTRASIANIEHGKQRLLAHTLVQIAGILRVKLEELLPRATASVQLVAEPDDVRRMEEALRDADVPADTI